MHFVYITLTNMSFVKLTYPIATHTYMVANKYTGRHRNIIYTHNIHMYARWHTHTYAHTHIQFVLPSCILKRELAESSRASPSGCGKGEAGVRAGEPLQRQTTSLATEVCSKGGLQCITQCLPQHLFCREAHPFLFFKKLFDVG